MTPHEFDILYELSQIFSIIDWAYSGKNVWSAKAGVESPIWFGGVALVTLKSLMYIHVK